MTLRHLRIFVEVVNCGKMSEAASRMFISQSSISQAISDLENYYQVKLFERLSKRLFLTEAGKDLYGLASKVILAYDEMDKYMDHITNNQIVRIGATFTIGATILPQMLCAFDAECPDVTTKVVVNRTPILENQLLQGEMDIALVEGSIKSPDLIAEHILKDELFLVCSLYHPFAHKKQVKLEELEGQDFVMREPTSKTRKIFESYLSEGQIKVTEKWTCNNLETIKAAVIGGYGLSILSARYIRQEQEKGIIRAIPIEGIKMVRDFSLVYHKSKYHFPAFQTFLALCHDYQNNPHSYED